MVEVLSSTATANRTKQPCSSRFGPTPSPTSTTMNNSAGQRKRAKYDGSSVTELMR